MTYLNFLFETWLLWPVLFIFFASFAYMSENDKGGWATFFTIITLLGMQFGSDYKPLSYAAHEPINTLLFIIGYLVLGAIYMFVKWAFVARKLNRKWIADGKQATTSIRYNRVIHSLPLVVSEWRGELMTWFAFWIFSAAWTLLDDPIRIIAENVYELSARRLQTISDSFAKG